MILKAPIFLATAFLSIASLGAWTHVFALEPVRVAQDVYAFLGHNGEASAENAGNTGNSGFIVGPSGVVVVDTGSSYHHGKAMLSAIAAVTSKPVTLVIITHAVQDFVFGAAAFAEQGIPLLAHRKTDELMSARCEHCLSNLRKALGEEIMTGTRMILPQQLVDSSIQIEAGGRAIELLYFGWASTPGDLAVFDARSGVLFAGGIVMGSRIPELRDGDFKGWLAALTSLSALSATRVVPAYGPLLYRQDIDKTGDYLRDLDSKMRQLYKAGAGLMEAVDGAEIEHYATWSLYADLHRRNALRRYLQLEIEDLER